MIDADSGKVLRVVTLQYNPDTLTRSLQIKGVGGDSGDHSEPTRLKGPPVESIKLDAEIDATDKLEAADSSVTDLGLHAQLALLETLVYPSSADLRSNNSSAKSGSIEIVAMQKPLILFVWSKRRVLPVRITEFSITEEGFDAALNPIRAKVSLGMRVLTVDDVGFDNRGGSIFMSYLEQKEQMASGIATKAFGSLGITGLP
ncbi:MAG: hypothetical protein JNM66_10060 [Bryobacterales bacterium]|nr:hypothetical protein [Bryobacterales bacterium]